MTARCFVVCLSLLALDLRAAPPETTCPDFSLPLRGSAQTVSLQDLRGSVVVLDFFAHWCVPCARSSAELERDIRAHYERAGGNTHGVPVRVLGVNIEAARPDKTDAFITRAGMKEVLEDTGAVLFRKLGAAGTPLIVVIDATRPAAPEIIYRKAGFDGAPKLREVIDTVQPAGASSPLRITSSLGQTVDPDLNDRASVDFASMWSEDILLADTAVDYRRFGARTDLGLSLTYGYINLDYVPESPVESPNKVEANRFGLQTRGRYLAAEKLTLNGALGGYAGYMDYRSLWLNEHFRQLFEGRPGYEEADPWGVNASGGLRWEYLPACGFIQGDVGYMHDIIAPGYNVLLTFPPTLVRFRDAYDTVNGKLTLENVLSPRVRAMQEFQITSTTDRQLRYAGQTSWNWAAAESWVVRFVLAGTLEEPQFKSWFTSLHLERDFEETFFVSLFARYYEDTGQIENALLPDNTAAPPLHALETGLGFRWQGRTSSLKLVAGPYFTRYQDPGPGASTFGQLYSDRDWFSVQFAFLHQF